MKYFSGRLDLIFDQGMPTKAQILDAFNKGSEIDKKTLASDCYKSGYDNGVRGYNLRESDLGFEQFYSQYTEPNENNLHGMHP